VLTTPCAWPLPALQFALHTPRRILSRYTYPLAGGVTSLKSVLSTLYFNKSTAPVTQGQPNRIVRSSIRQINGEVHTVTHVPGLLAITLALQSLEMAHCMNSKQVALNSSFIYFTFILQVMC